LVVGGVLPIIAGDLEVSVATAGQLITVFALVFAIAGPILLSLTAKMERKKLFLIILFIFFLGNIFTYFIPTFVLVMIARVLTAASAGLIIVLAVMITVGITISSKREVAIW